MNIVKVKTIRREIDSDDNIILTIDFDNDRHQSIFIRKEMSATEFIHTLERLAYYLKCDRNDGLI